MLGEVLGAASGGRRAASGATGGLGVQGGPTGGGSSRVHVLVGAPRLTFDFLPLLLFFFLALAPLLLCLRKAIQVSQGVRTGSPSAVDS